MHNILFKGTTHRERWLIFLCRNGRAAIYPFHRLMWIVQLFKILDRIDTPRLTLNRHQDDQ